MKISENAKNILIALFWLSLTFGLIFLIFKFGLGAAVQISEFLQKRQPEDKQGLTDSFLPEPKFFSVPTATNSAELPVQGYSLANKEVVVTLNEIEFEPFPVNSEGRFEGVINLTLGENDFFGVTRDFKKNTSARSELFTVFYSDTPPSLEIIEPEDGSIIRNNPNISIKGKSESSSKVYINDHLVLIESSGDFTYPAKLQKGENRFKISAIDPAQNKTETEITFQFRP